MTFAPCLRVTERMIVDWRETVWQHAVALLAAPDAEAYEHQRVAVERVALQRAEWMLGRVRP
ncbi:hypothetical protein [Caldilinea sp.]|uniref:hypothetical protein n=1 Tax=Caldilinea sp. TaxID=2293560 RepID=UPI002CCD055E|nr:hypothetical protein [Anaerolineales bacterium]HQY92877.1 hypothetical protein [Caldilinea sp.]HRA68781.1 hypothetical protein [Caldilinea sp.]